MNQGSVIREARIILQKYMHMHQKYNDALQALLSIKEKYPHVFKECVSDEQIEAITRDSVK